MLNTILITIALVMTTITAAVGMVWLVKNIHAHLMKKHKTGDDDKNEIKKFGRTTRPGLYKRRALSCSDYIRINNVHNETQPSRRTCRVMSENRTEIAAEVIAKSAQDVKADFDEAISEMFERVQHIEEIVDIYDKTDTWMPLKEGIDQYHSMFETCSEIQQMAKDFYDENYSEADLRHRLEKIHYAVERIMR